MQDLITSQIELNRKFDAFKAVRFDPVQDRCHMSRCFSHVSLCQLYLCQTHQRLLHQLLLTKLAANPERLLIGKMRGCEVP